VSAGILPSRSDDARARPRQTLAVAPALATVQRSKRQELKALFAANRRLFKAYVLREQLDRLWTYKTRTGVLNFLNGWIDALRWQQLPEMDRLGEFLFKHLNGIVAYCDHPVRFGVVESVNTTIECDASAACATRRYGC
jgi:transposase